MTKRAFDLFWAGLGLCLLVPIFLVIAILIKLEDGGPVFYLQERVGRRGLHFRIRKFRTMVVDADKRGPQITVGRDPRVTRLGYWLRKFKIDELPQLVNVWKGEMSLVGPRPEVPHYVAMYSQEQARVLELLPGITDVASIRYRNESDFLARAADPERVYIQEIMPHKIRLNLEYEAKASIWTDFLVIVRTIFTRRPTK